ncbi:DUF4242 domain-containing protein [Salegentibacter sp. JZCK2]|uniref:nickel-binding protein n=1 Tax=Salegentibacter tibetensis TaxID=2873600 RepID=UPI001CCF55DD|nr:nickel-binding protein [Salegentibacter tibetensis]MBZ9729564.1 DUF4242 domain-containing protein [Salegentibacter tibetensis]
MPIYMDYHIFPGVTVEEVKAAHITDKETQARYGVKYHQFWVNKDTGSIFCLIEGPNPEACIKVHEEAHGNVACNIIEVEPGLINLFMGKNPPVQNGIVYAPNGEIDTGFRFIMVLDIVVNTSLSTHADIKKFVFPKKPRSEAIKIIQEFQGELVENLSDDSIIAVFMDADQSMKCALNIQEVFTKKLQEEKWKISFKIGLTEGQPVTMADSFFKDSIDYAKRLSLIARENQILLSHCLKKTSSFQTQNLDQNKVKVLEEKHRAFIGDFCDYAESNLASDKLSVKTLSQEIGLSRPQLYRKIKSITGRSPKKIIRDLKLRTALNLIKDNKLNVSQVAYEVGYDDPSYFSKCFTQKFGISPSKII